MKKLIILPIVLFTFSIFSQNIEGYWKAVSDKTNKKYTHYQRSSSKKQF